MPVSFAELHDGVQIDYKMTASPVTGAGAVRRFISPGYNETAAIASAINGANGGLNIGAAHPREPSLKLATLSAVEHVGSGSEAGWIIEARYIPQDASFPDFPRDESGAGVITKSASSEVVTIRFPLLARRYVFDPISGFSNITYDKDEGAYDVPGARYTYQVNINRSPDNSMAIITPRLNKIHQLPPFGNTKWLFTSFYINQIKDSLWSYVYSWYAEPGNEALLPPDLAQPGNPSGADLIYVPPRLPHQRYVVKWSGLNPSEVTVSPSIEVIDPFEEEPNGWSALPGLVFGGGGLGP